MMPAPLVTVICLCHNQARFVAEAIESVLAQTWQNLQLIVLDDASTDDSPFVIQQCLRNHSHVLFLQLTKSLGNCKAFNHALKFSEGDYVIDLAADDVLMPQRVSKGVQALEQAGEKFGINFTDALWIKEDGTRLYRHSERFPHHTVPQGDVYKELIRRFFICSPTVMARRSVYDVLNGYDETLAYEDFDFWIRSSRSFFYCYAPEVLVKKRVVKNSMSERQFTARSPQLRTTFRVCEKALSLNRNREEQRALAGRLMYEMRVCVRLLDFRLLLRYMRLYCRNARMRYNQ